MTNKATIFFFKPKKSAIRWRWFTLCMSGKLNTDTTYVVREKELKKGDASAARTPFFQASSIHCVTSDQ